jgi:hypothetical protein
MLSKAEQELVDEYGELSRRIDEFRPVVARQKKLKDTIAGWFAGQPEDTHEVEGKLYRVQVGPCALERKIVSMRRLYRLLGVTKFLEWCTFPLAALDKLVTDQDDIVEISQTGPRSVKSVLMKAAAIAEQPTEKRSNKKAA